MLHLIYSQENAETAGLHVDKNASQKLANFGQPVSVA